MPPALSQLIINLHTASSGRIITNNRLSTTFQMRSGIRQRDPFAPFLFILTIEPLLANLEAKGVEVQAHCDDLAVAATPENISLIYDSLKEYEASAGALLNTNKSFLISKTPPPYYPFPSSPEPRRYLGFYISASGLFRLPPNLRDECIDSLIRIKNLPLSLAGRMSVASSYIRPKLFYRLSITTSSDINSYKLAERWFLSSSKVFDDATGSRAPFSEKKLSHPGFFFRIRPFNLALQLARLSVFIRTSPLRTFLQPTTRSWLPKQLRSTRTNTGLALPWRIPSSSFTSLIPLMGLQTSRINSNGFPNPRGHHFIITAIPHQPIPFNKLKNNILQSLYQQPLPLSRAQHNSFQTHRSNPKQLFRLVHKPQQQQWIWGTSTLR